MALDKDDIKQLIAILQKGLLDDNNTEESEQETKESAVVKKKSKQTKPQKKKDTNNKFEKMPEFRMHKEDVEIDRKLAKHPRTERSRNFSTIDVRCRVCGKEENVNPVLVESKERYKCNRCSRSSG